MALSRKSRKAWRNESLIEIARTHHVEARGLQRLRNEARIVGGRGERSTHLIGSVADHQRDALFGMRGARRQHGHEGDQGRKKVAMSLRIADMAAPWEAEEERQLLRGYYAATQLNGI